MENRVMSRQLLEGIFNMYRLLLLLCVLSTVGIAHAGTNPRPLTRTDAPTIVQVHEGHTGGAPATGTVNSVDPGKHSINISHAAIRALKWPPMTMDFSVDPDVDLAGVKPGMKIDFTLIKGMGGMYEVHELHPADRK